MAIITVSCPKREDSHESRVNTHTHTHTHSLPRDYYNHDTTSQGDCILKPQLSNVLFLLRYIIVDHVLNWQCLNFTSVMMMLAGQKAGMLPPQSREEEGRRKERRHEHCPT
jgi:hypothetical protein